MSSLHLIADISQPIILSGGNGLVLSLLGFAGVVVLEVLVLLLLRWGKPLVSLGTSFLVNLATSLIGTGTFYCVAMFFGPYQGGVPSASLTLFLIAYVITVLIEWILLKLLRRSVKLSRALGVSAAMNFVSYLFLFCLSMAISLSPWSSSVHPWGRGAPPASWYDENGKFPGHPRTSPSPEASRP